MDTFIIILASVTATILVQVLIAWISDFRHSYKRLKRRLEELEG